MFRVLAITNRHLCAGSLIEQLQIICSGQRCPYAVILREKDLSAAAYGKLAQKAAAVCEVYQVPLILHSFWQIALALDFRYIHLPLSVLQTEKFQRHKGAFRLIGASVHSSEEAQEAAALGAQYLTAGHIYATNCKAGVPGRGLVWLQSVCKAVDIPVYAIGGISPAGEQFAELRQCGAAGACIMGGFMLLK